MRYLFAMAWLFVSLPASATTGLEWHWTEGQERRYAIHAEVDLAEGLQLLAVQNYMARISAFEINLVTTCTTDGAPAKKFTRLSCSVDDFQLLGTPLPGDEKMLPAIAGSWDEAISRSTVELELTADGRVRSLDLEGIAKDNDRQQAMQETARLILARAFAALDIHLPSKGDDKGKGSWKQKSAVAMELPSNQGSMGSVVVEQSLSNGKITTSGRGTMGGGEMIQVGDQVRPANMFDLTWQGEAVFDAEAGELVSNSYTISGKPTPSSLLAEAANNEYRQVVALKRLDPDEEVEALGPSGLLVKVND